MTGRCPAKGLMCLLATSVGPLLYSLQHLPFHFTERAHTHTHSDTDRRMYTCRHRQTGRMMDAHTYTHRHTTSLFTLHPSRSCPLSLIICSFPLKTPRTYGPLKPAVTLFAKTHTHTLPHPQCGPTSLLDFND